MAALGPVGRALYFPPLVCPRSELQARPSLIRCMCQGSSVSADTAAVPRRAVLQSAVILGGLLGSEGGVVLSARADESSISITNTVFLDIAIDGQPAGQIVVGLFGDDVPVGAQRFAELAVGRKGIGYRRKEFYKIGRNYIQNVGLRTFSLTGGREDTARFTGGETADAIVAEMAELQKKGSRPKNVKGTVSIVAIELSKPPPKTKLVARDGTFFMMEESGRPEPNGTEFMILTADSPELDATNTVVGRVVDGMDVVERIANVKVVQENTSSPYFQVAKLIGDTRAVVAEKGFNRPYSKVIISKCGQVR